MDSERSETYTNGSRANGRQGRGAELLRGLAWNIPAAVGGPVDLIEQALNLGLAGGGYAAHKAGLIRADQLPKPLEGSVGTTKWWAKGTPMEESADPRFVQGQIAGGLAAALYPSMPKKVDHGVLRSLLVPADWPERFGLAKTRPDGSPLGRLPGDLPGAEHVALPRRLSAEDTFSPANRAQIDRPGGVPLVQLAPEVANSPVEGLRVVTPRFAATPLDASAGGHLDMANNQAVVQMGGAGVAPRSANELLNVLHHEGTHGIDALAGSPGHGFAPLSPDEHARSLRWLAQNGLEGRSLADWLRRHQPSQFYRGNLGEHRAFVAGDTAPMIAPSTETLRVFDKKNRAQHPMNWYTQVQDAQGWFRLPLSAALLRDRRLQFGAPSDGWSQVFLGDPTDLQTPTLGILDQRFRLPQSSVAPKLPPP
jgi:hypothetical protein